MRVGGIRPVRQLRRVIRGVRRRIIAVRQITVRRLDSGAFQVSRLRGIGWLTYRLGDPAARHVIRAWRLRLRLPDASALVTLASSGLLTGQIRRLRVRLARSPEWLVTGVRPNRFGRTVDRLRWRRQGSSLTVEFGWSRPHPVHRALADAITAVVRTRPWDQASGPVYLLDRTAWIEHGGCWPQGVLADHPLTPERDPLGRPLGPHQPLPDPPAGSRPAPSLVTAVANPYGRRLVGAATGYRLLVGPDRLGLGTETGEVALWLERRHGPEAAVAGTTVSKYAVVSVDQTLPADPFVATAVRALAACGMVFAAPDPTVRSALDRLGVVTVGDAKEVDDLRGYALSVAASRRATIAGDAALRRTALTGEGMLPLPGVSILLSSMRVEQVETCLRYLAGQTYPELELLVGLHGYQVPEETRQRWLAVLPFPTRLVPFPADLPFGAVLGRLSRMADGELVTKADDDDHYGRYHVTDLVLAWHTSGADVVAKGSRFVHFPEHDETIDRAWAAPEIFNVTPAGGTMLLSRGTLQQYGGWSHSSKHVDTDLLRRIRAVGGLVYRTHGLEYVYVRRTIGHTFVTDIAVLAEQSERSYPGLPREIIVPDDIPPGVGSSPSQRR